MQGSHSAFWYPLYLYFFLCLSLVLNLQSLHFSQNLSFQPLHLILLIFCFLLFFLLDLNRLSHCFFRYFRQYLSRHFYRSLRHYLSLCLFRSFHPCLSRHFCRDFHSCLSRHFPRLFPSLMRHLFSLLYLMSPARNYLYLYLYRLHNKPSRSHLSICLQYQLYNLPLQYLHTSFHMKLYLFLQNNSNIRLSTAIRIKALPHWQF